MKVRRGHDTEGVELLPKSIIWFAMLLLLLTTAQRGYSGGGRGCGGSEFYVAIACIAFIHDSTAAIVLVVGVGSTTATRRYSSKQRHLEHRHGQYGYEYGIIHH